MDSCFSTSAVYWGGGRKCSLFTEDTREPQSTVSYPLVSLKCTCSLELHFSLVSIFALCVVWSCSFHDKQIHDVIPWYFDETILDQLELSWMCISLSAVTQHTQALADPFMATGCLLIGENDDCGKHWTYAYVTRVTNLLLRLCNRNTLPPVNSLCASLLLWPVLCTFLHPKPLNHR